MKEGCCNARHPHPHITHPHHHHATTANLSQPTNIYICNDTHPTPPTASQRMPMTIFLPLRQPLRPCHFGLRVSYPSLLLALVRVEV